ETTSPAAATAKARANVLHGAADVHEPESEPLGVTLSVAAWAGAAAIRPRKTARQSTRRTGRSFLGRNDAARTKRWTAASACTGSEPSASSRASPSVMDRSGLEVGLPQRRRQS